MFWSAQSIGNKNNFNKMPCNTMACGLLQKNRGGSSFETFAFKPGFFRKPFVPPQKSRDKCLYIWNHSNYSSPPGQVTYGKGRHLHWTTTGNLILVCQVTGMFIRGSENGDGVKPPAWIVLCGYAARTPWQTGQACPPGVVNVIRDRDTWYLEV